MSAYQTDTHPILLSYRQDLPDRMRRYSDTLISGPHTQYVRGSAWDFPMAVRVWEAPYLPVLSVPRTNFSCIGLVQHEGGYLAALRSRCSISRNIHFPITLQTLVNIRISSLFSHTITSRFIHYIHFHVGDLHTQISEHSIIRPFSSEPQTRLKFTVHAAWSAPMARSLYTRAPQQPTAHSCGPEVQVTHNSHCDPEGHALPGSPHYPPPARTCSKNQWLTQAIP